MGLFSMSGKKKKNYYGGSGSYGKPGFGGFGGMMGMFGSFSSSARKRQMRQQQMMSQPVSQSPFVPPVSKGAVGAKTRCPQCGASVPAGSKFCLECGSKIGGGFCSGCGAALPPDAKFCPGCGTPRA